MRSAEAQQRSARVHASVTVVAAPIAPLAAESLATQARSDGLPRLLPSGVRMVVADLPRTAAPSVPTATPRVSAPSTRRVVIEYVGS